MSSKPPKPSFHNTQYESLMYPLYMTPHDDFHAAATTPEPSAAAVENSFFSRANGGEDVHGVAATGVGTAAVAGGAGGLGLPYAERYKRWSLEQERAIANNELQNYTMTPLLSVSNDHTLLSPSAAQDMREAAGAGGHANLLGSLGSTMRDDINVGFMPLSHSATPYPEEGFASTNKPHFSTIASHADMEILRVTHGHNTINGSVHLFEDIPSSSLTHQSVGCSYNFPYGNVSQQKALPCSSSSFINLQQSHIHQSQLLPHHHHHHHHHPSQWGSSLRASSAASAGSHPHAELLLLPGIAESAVEASPSSATHSAVLSGSNKLDLLHVSSLHDKQASMALPLGATGGGGRLPSAIQMWNADKLDMAVGLGLRDISARSTLSFTEADHFGAGRGMAPSGLALLLQSPQQRAESAALSLEAARYNTRSTSGSLGVLRNSKYLKATQQLLNEFCNVCKDGNALILPAGKSSMSHSNMQWSAAEGQVDEDHGQLSRAFFSRASSIASQKGGNHFSQPKSGGSVSAASNNQQEKAAAQTTPETTPKQLPADERCHLQMRKARLIAMVEELDRRYQQYRDQMQLIVTSFESATGMGGATPYTTLAKKAMSRQFRSLRDAIGDHIRSVCRMLGEEVSSVPILSRGETPRLRLVDQRLRHQRSLQQIGMLPQQQAWRPQRGLPERSVTVLRAWLFEHFLHPYPKDSEKSMLARLTGLSRNQVSNWFINARVRLWKPMIEEMYIEESKALEMQQLQQGDGSTGNIEDDGSGAAGSGGDDVGAAGMSTLMLQEEGERQDYGGPSHVGGGGGSQALLSSWPQPSHYSSSATNDLHSFIHFHSSASTATDPPPLPHHDPPSHPFSWMKPNMTPTVGDISSIVTDTQHHHHHHHPYHHHQQQQQQMSSEDLIQQQAGRHHSSNFIKNGVSLTLGLQQPPPHSSYNSTTASHNYHVRPSEALLF